MAVDITALIPSLQREISPPGTNLYPSGTAGQLLGYLQDAFWEAKLNAGIFSGYKLDPEDDTQIIPSGGDGSADDMDRTQQQLIVMFAGYRITLTAFQNINSQFRAKAGAVEFEQQKSAQTLKTILDAIRERIKKAVENTDGTASGILALVLDGYAERSTAMRYRDVDFVSG